MSETEDAPDRIWVYAPTIPDHNSWIYTNPPPAVAGFTEYVRADLVQAKDAEIARLRAELNAALAEIALLRAQEAPATSIVTGAGLGPCPCCGSARINAFFDHGSEEGQGLAHCACFDCGLHSAKFSGDGIEASFAMLRGAWDKRPGDLAANIRGDA